MKMATLSFSHQMVITLLLLMLISTEFRGTEAGSPPTKRQRVTCNNRRSKCFLKYVTCPAECPSVKPYDQKAKACYLDCYSPKCEAVCRRRKPNCDGLGAACHDPRFIGGDSVVFYFHGKSGEHFALISDTRLQINARFIGLRPVGRTRDFTWIQALGLMFGPHSLTLEATKAEAWDENMDHIQLSYDGKILELPESYYSEWTSPDQVVRVERTANQNSVSVTVQDVVEIFANVVPITEQENKVHNYQIPENDSFAHLEVQFRFFSLSPEVDGVLGRTYRPDFENPAKAGVEMAVVGGEDRFRTSSLLSSDCRSCNFDADNVVGEGSSILEYGTMNCTSGLHRGYGGTMCKK